MALELVDEMLGCCHRGDLRRLQVLLNVDSSLVISSNVDGRTCLHITCLTGNEALTDFLLEKGANIHARTTDGSTPLCEAAAGGWSNIILKLVSRGALINPPCQLVSPLHEAAMYGKAECCRLLISLGANLDKSDCWYGTPLHAAVHSGHVRTAKALLDGGASINATKIHATPLHYACEHGDLPMIVLLLMYGADVYCLNNNDRSPGQLLPVGHPARPLLFHFETQPRSLAFWCRLTALKSSSRGFRNDCAYHQRDRLAGCMAQMNYPGLLVRFLLHQDTDELIEHLMAV